VSPRGVRPSCGEARYYLRMAKTSFDLAARVEAVIFSADKPIPCARLASGLAPHRETPIPEAEVRDAIAALNDDYEKSGRTFRIEEVAGGFRVMILADMAQAVAAFQSARASHRLSRAAMETLAIIAYRQPITRAQLEAIRGVGCGEVLRTLLERQLVGVTGRAEELGRPLLYGTTKQFLDLFGLKSIKDLPSPEELAPVPSAG